MKKIRDFSGLLFKKINGEYRNPIQRVLALRERKTTIHLYTDKYKPMRSMQRPFLSIGQVQEGTKKAPCWL